MKLDSLSRLTLIVALVFASACQHSNSLDIEIKTLSDAESARQIDLLKLIRPNEIEGKLVSDFPELFSVADVICSENGKIVRYVFHRKGEGGNDDGTDSYAIIEVRDGLIQTFYISVYPS